MKIKIEPNNIQYNFYWTDDYNNPKRLYYIGNFVLNGFLNVFNPQGQYFYDTLGVASNMFLE